MGTAHPYITTIVLLNSGPGCNCVCFVLKKRINGNNVFSVCLRRIHLIFNFLERRALALQVAPGCPIVLWFRGNSQSFTRNIQKKYEISVFLGIRCARHWNSCGIKQNRVVMVGCFSHGHETLQKGHQIKNMVPQSCATDYFLERVFVVLGSDSRKKCQKTWFGCCLCTSMDHVDGKHSHFTVLNTTEKHNFPQKK